MGDLILPGPDNVSILGSAKRHFMPFSNLETFYDNLKATDLIFYVIDENIKSAEGGGDNLHFFRGCASEGILENPYVSVFTFFNIPKGTCIFIPATDVI
jgi:trimethylamine:corrinoid methyltransferase-like protein